MGPPDGPSRPNQSDWARMIQTELNSWDPSCLPPSFHPRSQSRPTAAWRPLPLALAVLLGVLLAATALAGGPRALGGAIETLTGSGKPQPSSPPATRAPTGALVLQPGPAASSATPATAVQSPNPTAQAVASQPAAQQGRQAAGPGADAAAGNQAGAGSGGGLTGAQVPPQQTPAQLLPPPSTPPIRPRLPTPPPLPVLQPGQTGVPSPSSSANAHRDADDQAGPRVHDLPAPAPTPSQNGQPRPSK